MATYTTTQAPLPWMEPYLQDYMGRAQELANTPYQASPGTYTGPNATLQAGWQTTANRAMQGSPVMSQANQQLQNTMGGAFLGRGAMANPFAAQMNPFLDAGNPFAGQFNPYAGVRNEAANAANQFASMNNPFLQQSIDAAQGDLVRNYNLTAKPAWDTAMQRSGSFGNTGVMEMQQNSANDLQRNLGRIGTDMRMNAYNQAANLTENQLARQFQAGSQLQQNLYGAGQQQMQNLFNTGQQQMQNRFGAGQQFAQNLFGSGESLAGRQDAITGQERGYQQQALGMAPSFANQDYVDANALINAGQQMQGFNQGQADQNYRWWQEAQNYPRQQLAAYGQALGVGGGGTSTQTAPDPSTASQLLGGGLTGAMIYKMLFGG